jgi:hypothetical protein
MALFYRSFLREPFDDGISHSENHHPNEDNSEYEGDEQKPFNQLDQFVWSHASILV